MKTTSRNRLSQRISTLAAILLIILIAFSTTAQSAKVNGDATSKACLSAVGEDTANSTRYPCLNVLENEEIGSELQFMRISDRFDGRLLKDFQSAELTLEPDQIYDIAICIHNAASPSLGADGIAHDVRLNLELPSELAPEQPGKISAELSATDTSPNAISNILNLTASAPLTISSENFYISRYTTQKDFHAEISLEFEKPEPNDSKLQATSLIGDIGPGEDNMQFVFVSFATQAAEVKTNSLKTPMIIGISVLVTLTILVVSLKIAGDKKCHKRFSHH